MKQRFSLLWAAGFVAIAGLAGPVGAAETPMSAAEFEAYTTGKTLFYGAAGRDYGAEQYLPGRRVYWSRLDGKCEAGRWYPRGSQICFVYGDPADPQCWSFFKLADGVRARFENTPPDAANAPPGNSPGGDELYETRQTSAPLLCLGPEVGV